MCPSLSAQVIVRVASCVSRKDMVGRPLFACPKTIKPTLFILLIERSPLGSAQADSERADWPLGATRRPGRSSSIGRRPSLPSHHKWSIPMWILMYVFSYSVSPAATNDRAEWRLLPTVVFQEFSE